MPVIWLVLSLQPNTEYKEFYIYKSSNTSVLNSHFEQAPQGKHAKSGYNLNLN